MLTMGMSSPKPVESRAAARGWLGRTFVWCGGGVMVSIAAVFVWFRWDEATWLARAREDSVARLRGVADETSARAAVNYLGTFLTFTNGDWVVIRYRDIHVNRVQSHSLAKTSDGRWLESERHFCGTIQGLGRRADEWRRADSEYQTEWRSMWQEDGPGRHTNSVPSGLDLLPLLEASNLDSAVQALLRLGFRPTEP